ncbi:ArsR/SmtB family transcription factor [Spiribacter vilamensis]|uniref:ArsR family transcriptional regulator n=1 Tax=Spiribacter vilamensis TaxID=531306 RepID=A0A4V2GJ39_9GAMM|nr:metalloregulator ArsR/SmtB family transcription factor [Spiribacter vilamensis]RZU98805.1 ArsR family transcriptional regulator [Spiribacter vilamensis]TVO62175.1 winged helix-turn-helix transcriptional regulator [Spiribacter vilamensis]
MADTDSGQPESMESIAHYFRLLGDAQRLGILHCLQSGERTVGQIAAMTGASPSNVSKHLATLRSSGLVGRRQAGNRAYFEITAPFIFELCDIVCSGAHERLAREQASLPTR